MLREDNYNTILLGFSVSSIHRRMGGLKKKIANEEGGGDEDEEAKIKSIIFGPLIALLLAPITFQLTRISQPDLYEADLFAAIITTLLSVIFIILIRLYLIHNCHQKASNTRGKNISQASSFQGFSSLFGLLSSPGWIFCRNHDDTNNNNHKIDPNNNDKNLNGSQRSDGQDSSFLTRIDSKYFKPKFILHELQTFWGTTCTVVTWGSFYVIGGTIVATEKIARKIKNKCNREPQHYDHNVSSRGTGRSASFASYSSSFSDESIKSTNSNQNSPKRSLKRVSSWTKKSFSSIKKRFNKFVVTNVPQITNTVTITKSK